MATTFRQGYLEGQSISGHSVKGLIQGNYDLLVLTSSWDSRCVSICDASDILTKYIMLILFEIRDPFGFRDNHDRRLIEYITSKCDKNNTIYLRGYSVEVESMWQQIMDNILTIRESQGRPLRILLDLSTCPRYYALALVGSCLSYGIAEYISVVYAEGMYRSCLMDSATTTEYIFSKGHWRTVSIPSLEGSFDPGKKKYYLVSVGFEGVRTLQIINREDPDSISILFPEPGYIPEYVEVARTANEELIQSYKVDEGQIVRVHAGDAIAAWKALQEASIENPASDNVFYLCSGTKPHALGLALRAMILGFPTVLYRVPENHNPLNVVPTGNYWRYDIRDLSCLIG